MNNTHRKFWPLGLYMIGCLVMTWGITRLMDSGPSFLDRYGGLPSWVLMGLLSGQGYFIALTAGLMGASWAAGLMMASGWMAVLTVALCAGFETNFGDFFTRTGDAFGNWPVVALYPACIFIAAFPLLACRFFIGWRLTRSDVGNTPRERLTISDFFRFTTMLASVGLLGRVALGIHPDADHDLLDVSLLLTGYATALCLLALVPALLLDRRLTRSRMLWLWLLLLTSCFGAGTMFFMCMTQQFSWQDGLMLAAFFPCQTITGLIGIACLKSSGFRLIAYAPKAGELPSPVLEPTSRNPFEDPASSIESWRSWRSSWIVPVATAALAMLLMGVQSYWTRYWASVTEMSRAIEQRVTAAGGHVEVSRGRGLLPGIIYAVALPPSARDSDLQQLAQCDQIRSLDLSGSQVTDKGLEAISHLRCLDNIELANTSITDAGLRSLSQNSHLQTLVIGHSRVTAKGLMWAMKQFPHLSNVGASGLGLKDYDLQQLKHRKIRGLDLSDNALSDDSLLAVDWKAWDSLSSINLSGNPIHGAGLAGIPVNSLILGQVPLRDAELTRALPDMFKQDPARSSMSEDPSVFLAETELTDGFLKELARFDRLGTLKLGDGNFTDQGLAEAHLSNITLLMLCGKQFTGECFRTWRPDIEFLDMSYSGITDANVATIASLNISSSLFLSHTAITDAALPALVKSPATHIQLEDTKITFEGLMMYRFPNGQYVCGTDSFTEQQRQALLKLGYIQLVK